MRRLNTAEFKRELRSLREPALVTVAGKSIGVFTPTISRLPDYEGKRKRPSKHQVPARTWHARPLEEVDGYSRKGFIQWRSAFPYPEDPNAR